AEATATSALSPQKTAVVRQLRRITSRAIRIGCRFAFGEDADSAKFFVALLEQFINGNFGNVLQSPAQRSTQIVGDRLIIRARPSLWFGRHFVDHVKFQQILRS